VIQRLIAGMKLGLRLNHPRRNLKVLPDDVFIVSYPKSGNTWTRFLIANLVYPGASPDFTNIDRIIPAPGALTERQLSRLPRPRIVKSHEYFDPRYRRVIYLVRDPRDVALSQYHFQRKRAAIDDQHPIEQFVARFITGETSPYASWGENVAGWLATRYHHPGFLLLRYEDLIVDTESELAKVASFLGLTVSPERLSEAVRRSSAETMRKLEEKQALKWAGTRQTRQDIPFIRTAKSGNWQTELPDYCVAMIEAAWGPLMRWLGYATVHEQQEKGDTLIEAIGERVSS